MWHEHPFFYPAWIINFPERTKGIQTFKENFRNVAWRSSSGVTNGTENFQYLKPESSDLQRPLGRWCLKVLWSGMGRWEIVKSRQLYLILPACLIPQTRAPSKTLKQTTHTHTIALRWQGRLGKPSIGLQPQTGLFQTRKPSDKCVCKKGKYWWRDVHSFCVPSDSLADSRFAKREKASDPALPPHGHFRSRSLARLMWTSEAIYSDCES